MNVIRLHKLNKNDCQLIQVICNIFVAYNNKSIMERIYEYRKNEKQNFLQNNNIMNVTSHTMMVNKYLSLMSRIERPKMSY